MFFILVGGDYTQGCGCSQASDVVRARTIGHRYRAPSDLVPGRSDVTYIVYACSIPNTAATDRNKVVWSWRHVGVFSISARSGSPSLHKTSHHHSDLIDDKTSQEVLVRDILAEGGYSG